MYWYDVINRRLSNLCIDNEEYIIKVVAVQFSRHPHCPTAVKGHNFRKIRTCQSCNFRVLRIQHLAPGIYDVGGNVVKCTIIPKVLYRSAEFRIPCPHICVDDIYHINCVISYDRTNQFNLYLAVFKCECETRYSFNFFPPIYMRQWTGSTLVEIMDCRLFGDKPLSKIKQEASQLDL